MTDLVQRLRIRAEQHCLTVFYEAADRIEQLSAEVGEQCRINGMGAERELALLAKVERLERELSEYKAARYAYASEFPLDANGDPDVGSIHENIRKLMRENAELRN
jgi:hypothetical protein